MTDGHEVLLESLSLRGTKQSKLSIPSTISG